MSDPQHGITPTHEHGGHGIQKDAPHGHHGAAVSLPFGEADLAEFHKNDIQAGGAIIVLMTAIFSIGLILYSVIAIVVAS
jgi:hypothetical protein